MSELTSAVAAAPLNAMESSVMVASIVSFACRARFSVICWRRPSSKSLLPIGVVWLPLVVVETR